MLKQPKKKQQEDRPSEASSVFPMQLYPGDRITDDTGEWEIVGLPSTSKTVRARVRKVGEPAVTEERIWEARKRVTVRRG